MVKVKVTVTFSLLTPCSGRRGTVPLIKKAIMNTTSNTSEIIINITITISFMQGIDTYIPETNHVPTEYNVAAILSIIIIIIIIIIILNLRVDLGSRTWISTFCVGVQTKRTHLSL
jgi:hypothetical protein